MEIPIKVQLGIFGQDHNAGTLEIDEGTIGNSSSWAGSYHILSMGRHYKAYIYNPSPELRQVLNFPDLDYFSRLTSKTKSIQVVGNIGECIGAILARKRLRANISDIALLTTNAQRMRPDYLMHLDSRKIGILFSEANLNQRQLNYFSGKKWWAVESKASMRLESYETRIKALSQLISFWAKEREALQDSVGYGLIITFFYEDYEQVHRPHELWISLILPQNYGRFMDRLNNPRFSNRGKEIRDRIVKNTFRYFYGCTNS